MAEGVIWRTRGGRRVWGIKWHDRQGTLHRKFKVTWTKGQARAALDVIQEKLRDGVPVVTEMTVTDLFHEWHEQHVKVRRSPAWVADTEIQYRLRIKPLIGHRKIDTVNKRVVNEMIAQMQRVLREKAIAAGRTDQKAGHRTINKTLTVLKGMFSFAVAIEQLSTNPVHGIAELPEEPLKKRDAQPLEVISEVASIASHLGDDLHDFQKGQRASWVPARDYTIIMLAALTGLRQSELMGLTWDKIDDKWIHVTHKLCRKSFTLRETKSRRGVRQVPLVGPAQKLIEEWRSVGASETIVFPNNEGDNYIRASKWEQKVWGRASKKLGVDFDFHELRHTFASMCLSAGRDVWEVANWIGDDPDMVKKVYGHYIPNSLGDTDRLDRMFAASATRQIGT